ncbi:MAG: glycoside hydrolase family 25 protein [Oscillospiraceae bacterium]|nr:glycoside hydrolase family 25 protein [Oscillospiraceae bacterium]
MKPEKIHKFTRFTVFMLILAIFTAFTSVTVFADELPDIREWDGESRLRSGFTYIVSEKLLINSDVTFPANSTVRIVSGGEITFTTAASVNVYGKIYVEKMGRLFTSGELTVRSQGTINISGEFLCSLSSKVRIMGSVNVNPNGSLDTSGEFNLHTGSALENSGFIRFLNSGNGIFSGKLTNKEAAHLRIAGELKFSSSGRFENAGIITVTDNGVLLNSGIITLETISLVNRFGTFQNTESGRIIDKNRHPTVERYWLSPQAIELEPAAIIHGIDISRWNGDINWEEVGRTNIEFAMIRIGFGAFVDSNGVHHKTDMDRRFREYIAGAQENGIEVGVYFYSYAQTLDQIIDEAYHLLNMLDEFKITYPIALDMEEPREDYIDNPSEMADAFLNIIADAGYFPMMYSYKSWLENYLTAEIREKYTVWVAHIEVPATTYKDRYYMWQYTWKGRVSGINGDVDLNIAYRDFSAYIKHHGLNNL